MGNSRDELKSCRSRIQCEKYGEALWPKINPMLEGATTF